MSVILLILFSAAASGSAPRPFSLDFHYIWGCYESSDVRVDILLNEDVVAYADFSNKQMVFPIPRLPQSGDSLKTEAYDIAVSRKAYCHSSLAGAKRAFHPIPPPRQDAPDISVYSRHQGSEAAANTLFCLANHFYPPSINFTWTKNGAEVTEGVSDLRYYHHGDGTFHRMSTLSFAPRAGDVYSCSVEHQALPRPLARSWELEKSPSTASPAVGFFGASLVLCLVGIGTGAYFFYKK